MGSATSTLVRLSALGVKGLLLLGALFRRLLHKPEN